MTDVMEGRLRGSASIVWELRKVTRDVMKSVTMVERDLFCSLGYRCKKERSAPVK